MTRLLVGAYAAFPPGDPAGAGPILDALAAHAAVCGLEVPFVDGLSRHPSEPDGWSRMVTAIPGTVGRNATDPWFGLASPDADGRAAALAFAAALLADVQALRAGGARVEAVELHSAPSGRADADAFRRSLLDLAAMDWGDTLLLVEHCDASTPDHRGEKDYLTLDEEIAVVAELAGDDPRWGIGLNWGRSAIEGRGVELPLAHVRTAAESGLLRSLIFSGATDTQSAFGAPWLDRHAPPRECAFAPAGAVLGVAEMRAAMDAAGDLPIVGVKFGLRPDDLPAEQRAAQLVAAVDVVAEALP